METCSHDRPPAARHARPWDGGVMTKRAQFTEAEIVRMGRAAEE